MASMTNAEAITMLDVAVDSCDNGAANPNAILNIYSGTVPTNVDTALSGNTLLASLDMSATAFGNASDDTPGAIAAAGAISDDTSADATGTATFFRILDQNTVRVPRIQGTAGSGSEELVLNSAAIQEFTVVQVTSLDVTLPES